ncbi:MFS transporter [Leptospira sp. 201903071]|uniref:MFS transporter n=1 Tax=Leptospira ainazelensis TaxID=2810034 RepID=UPI001965C69B|nr:MFS transporter [Leptospira ainazelensis]MBM9500135.1 MFS transporter [Leptospira ainazelensis]
MNDEIGLIPATNAGEGFRFGDLSKQEEIEFGSKSEFLFRKAKGFFSSEGCFVFLLSLIQFTHILDFMIMMPLGRNFENQFQITPKEFSILISSYTYSAFFAGILSSLFIDRFHRRTSALFLYSGFILGTLLCGIADSYWILFMGRILAGAFGGIISSVLFSFVGDLIPEERRGRATGVIMAAFSASAVIGVPASLKISSLFGWNAIFLSIVLVSLLILLAMFLILPKVGQKQNKEESNLQGLREIFGSKRYLPSYLLIGSVILGGFTVIPFFAPYLERNVGVSKDHLSLIYLIGGSITFFSARMIGSLSDRYGKKRMFYILVPLACVPILFFTNLKPGSIVLTVLCTSGFFALVSARLIPAMALITSSADQKQRGRFMTIVSAIQNLASGIGASIGGAVLSVKDVHSPYQNFEVVGFFAVAFNVAALFFVSKVKTPLEYSKIRMNGRDV